MDRNKKYKIALVIKTTGLEYDDRVRKEILTVQKLYPNIRFKIFAMLPENREYEAVTSYGIPYKSLYLPTRMLFGSAKMQMLKALDFYRVVRKELKEYDAIWCGDYHSFMIAALAPKKHLLWDLHELPTPLLGNHMLRSFLKYIFNRCSIIVHANPQRCDYLESLGLISDRSKHYAIRNFPNFDDVDTEYDDTYHRFMEWKGNRKCVYLQGLSDFGRSGYESISAVLRMKDLVAVVVGKVYSKDWERLETEFGDMLYERVFLTGRINQMKIPQYVNQCILSLVFYQNIRPNNYYCEANRFYQSVIMGLPVVVGNNPPMRDLVNKYGFGVSIDDDGRDVEKIRIGIEEVLAHYQTYQTNNSKYQENLIWDRQESIFREIVERLL